MAHPMAMINYCPDIYLHIRKKKLASVSIMSKKSHLE